MLLERVEGDSDGGSGRCALSPEGMDAADRWRVDRHESDRWWRVFAAEPWDHGGAEAGGEEGQLGGMLGTPLDDDLL